MGSDPSSSKCALQVLGQSRRNVHAFTGERMREAEPRRVQELALEPELVRTAVDGIAGDREPDRGEVNADLVRSAGLE